MKEKLKRLWIKDSGAVSVYAIIIILPIFILNALLIDTLRIISAERQIENAMDAALRSTLSQFQSDLAAFGLFAYGGESASSDFQNYVTKQIPNSGELSGFQNLATPTIDSATASFDTNRDLVDVDVFRHQVLESSKYQAPVQMGSDLVTFLFGGKGISQEEIDKTEELIEKYEEIIQLMKERNKQIDLAKRQLDQLLQIVKSDITDKVIGTKITSGDTIPSNLKTLNELLYYNTRYQELSEKEKLTKEEKEEMDNYESAMNLDTYKSVLDATIYYQDIPVHLVGEFGTLQNPKIGSAKYYNDKILELMGNNNELLEGLKQFTLQDQFFTDIINANDEIYEQIRLDRDAMTDITDPNRYSISQLIGGFYYFIEFNNRTAGDLIIKTIEDKLKLLNEKQVKKVEDHLVDYRIQKEELAKVDVVEAENEAEESFGSLWAMLNLFNDIKDQVNADSATYAELDALVQEYYGTTGLVGNADEPGRLQFIKDAFDRFKEFIAFIQGFPESVRNELYINEYILANFGIQEPYQLDDYNSYKYDTKQANYIVYGLTDPGMNYFMFIKDIVLILFVSNLIAQGLQGGFTSLPGFFAAITSAFTTTADQLRQLTTGNYKMDWNPFRNFGGIELNVTMPMFLRIIMAMKSTGESYNVEKLRRLQAVVTEQTDVKLNSASSYIEGNVTGRIKLWFIPQLAEILPGNVEGSYYIFEKKKVNSY